MSRIHVRPAALADRPAIDAVHRVAFPSDVEARLVALLIERGKATISLVAEIDEQVVGHILFSPATVGPASVGPAPAGPAGPAGLFEPIDPQGANPGPAQRSGPTTGIGLAPLAVLPAFQNQGVGSALVRAGLAECHRLGIPWVVVLGHETYYPRFGFAPASRWNLTGDYGSHEAFQFLLLTEAAASLRGGHIRYAPEFAEILGRDS